MIIFKPKTAAFHERSGALDTFCVVITKTHAQIKFKFCLLDTLAVRLFSYYFAFSFCNLQLSYLRIYFKAYA